MISDCGAPALVQVYYLGQTSRSNPGTHHSAITVYCENWLEDDAWQLTMKATWVGTTIPWGKCDSRADGTES